MGRHYQNIFRNYSTLALNNNWATIALILCFFLFSLNYFFTLTGNASPVKYVILWALQSLKTNIHYCEQHLSLKFYAFNVVQMQPLTKTYIIRLDAHWRDEAEWKNNAERKSGMYLPIGGIALHWTGNSIYIKANIHYKINVKYKKSN